MNNAACYSTEQTGLVVEKQEQKNCFRGLICCLEINYQIEIVHKDIFCCVLFQTVFIFNYKNYYCVTPLNVLLLLRTDKLL